MIQILRQGNYRLVETKANTRILSLDGKDSYAWINAFDIGELLVATHKHLNEDAILTLGKYRLYSVKDEPKLADTQHLELSVGNGVWQGYVLLTGLPRDEHIRTRIIPTREIITKTG